MKKLSAIVLLCAAASSLGMSGGNCLNASLPILPGASVVPLVITPQPDGKGAVTLSTDVSALPQTRTINWAFGDGSTAVNLSVASGAALTHTYLRPDTFVVSVFAFDTFGNRIAEGSQAIIVDVPGLGGFIDARSHVRLRTNMGDIVLRMEREKAPIATVNFERYVADGHYDNLVFHRVVPDFVVQAGAFRSNGQGANPRLTQLMHRTPVQSEAPNGLTNVRGTLSLALMGQDADSGSDQFFINLKDNPNLDTGNPHFTVFATVTSGMAVVDKIAKVVRASFNVDTLNGPSTFDDVPVQDVVIQSAVRE